MSTKPDGGPAFPTLMKSGDLAVSEGGLTVRDYFAAHAMAACPMSHPEDAAAWCYKRADAMVKAREL